ncbi:MAG: DNA topology modulation protein [Proteobacteria bacterium]|nr:DNA topology modulation protein [Pseudomonadota bacterium]
MQKIPPKIMIFGRSGSGKSTFALKLHKHCKIPLYHLDKHFFESNWVERNYQEFIEIQQKMVSLETWIIDGNAIRSLEMRYSRADLVLYFNYPRWLCYWRSAKRLFNKDPQIDDRAPESKERLSFRLICYMWGFEKRVANQITFLKDLYPHAKFIELRSDKDLQEFEKEFLK